MIKKNNVCSYGLTDYFVKMYPGETVYTPNAEQVKMCREFITTHCKPHKKGRSSYHFKHVVEEMNNTYISNGAFITAAIIEGCEMERIGLGPNVRVFVEYKKGRK